MVDFHALPASHGTYALHLSVVPAQRISIGSLGQQRLPAGYYFYVGSARGTGGLRARVGRYLRGEGVPHWHIDHLRAVAEVRDVCYTVTDSLFECVWSQALAQLPNAFIPVSNFGSSDCRSSCRAHLVAFPRHTDIASVARILTQTTPTSIAFLHYC